MIVGSTESAIPMQHPAEKVSPCGQDSVMESPAGILKTHAPLGMSPFVIVVALSTSTMYFADAAREKARIFLTVHENEAALRWICHVVLLLVVDAPGG